MSDSQRPQADLERVLEDVRRCSVPDLDWGLMEAELSDQFAKPLASKPNVESRLALAQRWRAPVGALLAAAVVVTLIWGTRGGPHDAEQPLAQPTPTIPAANSPLDSGKLQVGERLVAQLAPVQVVHRGLASWTLAPGSSCEVKALEPAVVIQLQSGQIDARVVPGLEPERFAVEVGGLRVAVRGTVFSVKRELGRANVRVSHGQVALGAVDQPPQTLLHAPASVRAVALGEAAGKIVSQTGEVTRLKQAPHPRPVRSRSSHPQPASPEPPTEAVSPAPEPTFEDVERGLGMVEAGLRTCLAKHTEGGAKVRVSLNTRLILRVAPDGTIKGHRFVPPLAPTIADCADAELGRIEFGASVVGTHIIRDLEITPEK